MNLGENETSQGMSYLDTTGTRLTTICNIEGLYCYKLNQVFCVTGIKLRATVPLKQIECGWLFLSSACEDYLPLWRGCVMQQ